MTITHTFISEIPDGADTTVVRPSDWNADHTIGNDTVTEAQLSISDNTTKDFSTTAHGFVPKGTNVGNFLKDDGTWAAVTASVTLDGIAAAAADQAGIANADWNIRWNWQKTTNSETAFELGESAASTGGTSTSGVPNQVLAKFSTVAASTMSPLSVYSRAAHVFSVSPSAPQILATAGTADNPPFAFAGAVNSGMYTTGSDIRFSVGGVQYFLIGAISGKTCVNSALGVTPAFTDTTNLNSGLNWPATNTLQISIAAAENSRFAVGAWQPSYGAGDTASYAINARKARGTVASPTVITTGDDLLTISGYGYVGATGTYVQAARITFDSTGTIANTTSGVGGIIRLEAAAVGAIGPVEIMRLTRGTTTGGGWATMNEADALPGTGDLAADDEVAFGCKAGNFWIAQNVGGAMKFLYIPIDGTTTTWTADGTGP